jgi:hypothetical protein
MSKEVQLSLYKITAKSVLLFGSESKYIKRLEAQQMGLLMPEAGYTLRDHTAKKKLMEKGLAVDITIFN